MRSIPLLIALLTGSVYSQPFFSGKVVEVLDGDNLIVQTKNNDRQRIRVAAIDAPEIDQAFGPESSAQLSNLMLNREIEFLTFKIEATGRYVAKIKVGDMDIAYELLKGGFVWYNGEKSEMFSTDVQLYSVAQEEARQKKLGLWSGENPEEPWIWSKGIRTPNVSARATDPPRKLDPNAQIFAGIVSTKLYYLPSCEEAKFDFGVQQKTFYSEKEAIDAGYRKGAKCTTPNRNEDGGSGAAPLRTARAIKIIQVTSDVDSYVGKLVTFQGEISMSTSFNGPFSGNQSIAYAFSLQDGTDSILTYTPKNSGAAKLRSLLLQRNDPTGWVKVRVKILQGSTPDNTYGLLEDFRLDPE